MSEQIQVTLHYRHGTSRMLSDGRIEVATMPYAAWQCACGKELENDNLYNSVLDTGCTCGRSYAIDWRHGLTPRVTLLSERKSMKLEEQVTSLALSKSLKELGIPQESLFYWVTTTYNEEPYLVSPESLDVLNTTVVPMSVYQDDGAEGYSWDVREANAAFTVAELGELLPRCYISWATPQNGEMKWWCHRMEHHFVTHEETPTFTAETEADARAKMLVYIHRKSA